MIFVKGKCDKGLTYLEIIVAMAVLGIVLMSVVKIISFSSRFDYGNEEMTKMALEAQTIMEIYKASDSPPVLNPGDYPYNYTVDTQDNGYNISKIHVSVMSQRPDMPGISSPYDLVSYKLTMPTP